MLTLEQVKERLKTSNIKAVAEAAGLHPNAVYRLLNDNAQPSYATVFKLAAYFEKMEQSK